MIEIKPLFLALLFFIVGFRLDAQTQETPLDPSGFVTKYDIAFHGIGPMVYVLPTPRTKEETITDSYKEKKDFYDTIARQLDYQDLLNEFNFPSATNQLKQAFQPLPSTDVQWKELIQKLESNNQALLAAAAANLFALDLLKNKDMTLALDYLKRAQLLAGASPDRSIIDFNLANAYRFNGMHAAAGQLQELYLKQAIAKKDLIDQGTSYVAIGLNDAYNKEYRAAENSIIRRAIPLFNKVKNYDGKIKAWIKLSKIYQLQNKHTEAQWFLIQARDLAKSKAIVSPLSEIEYRLGYSKYIQQNYSVAKLELEQAKSLAEQEDNKTLQLAISDKLGDIYLLMGDFKEAEIALDNYWKLRQEIFPSSSKTLL
ncbi:tetratricopeptide repeat protein [Sphingobacterium sp. HJSM2_6]|uniref:tetratricopeptide repeat protein n=1 Tax=Sphingobacterium sp. HJSM2_6 TaxID=3366264 RepID=UPI003BC0DAFF